jgi:hypothetical protein
MILPKTTPTSPILSMPQAPPEQVHPSRIWEQLTPDQQQHVYQVLVRGCLSTIKQSIPNTIEEEGGHDIP